MPDNATETRVNWKGKYDLGLESSILRWIEGKSFDIKNFISEN